MDYLENTNLANLLFPKVYWWEFENGSCLKVTVQESGEIECNVKCKTKNDLKEIATMIHSLAINQ